MKPMKYLLDEHVNPRLARAIWLHTRELVVWKIGDPGAPARGTLDDQILHWCEENEFVLITNNRASMPEHLTRHLENGRHIPGVFILNDKMTMGQTAEALYLIWAASLPGEYTDFILHLP
jgi:hypothetical protein